MSIYTKTAKKQAKELNKILPEFFKTIGKQL